MRIIPNFNNFKTTVVFIAGFLKSATTWNVTESNKNINIESEIRKNSNTILIDLDPADYLKNISSLSEEMINILNNLIKNTKVIIVTHSFGSFIGLKLTDSVNNFNYLLLIDPTLKTPEYLEELKLRDPNDPINNAKVKNFDDLPTGFSLPSKIIVWIHLNVEVNSTDNNLINKIKYLDPLVNRNIKSRLIINYDVSHMIHYNRPSVIINSIRELSKLK